jgi:pilus assembly protein CpaB
MATSGKKTGRIIIILAIIVIIVLGGVYLYLTLLQPQQTAEVVPPTTPVEEMVDIVITTQAIARGEVISENVLTTISYPKKDLVEGTFFTDLNAVVGKRAKYQLDARIPLTSSLILDAQNAGSIASFDIPIDMTALSIPIEKLSSVSYALQSGDHVMVIACMALVDLDTEYQTILPNNTAGVVPPSPAVEGNPGTSVSIASGGGDGSSKGRVEIDPTLNEPFYVVPSEAQRPRIVCQNVIQDAIVLHVGEFPLSGVEPLPVSQEPTPTPIPGETAPTTETAKPVAPDVVTLVVSPQDAIALNYMMTAGIKITLALRNPNNPNQITTDAVTQQYLMDQKNIPLPAKLPYGLQLITPSTNVEEPVQ